MLNVLFLKSLRREKIFSCSRVTLQTNVHAYKLKLAAKNIALNVSEGPSREGREGGGMGRNTFLRIFPERFPPSDFSNLKY